MTPEHKIQSDILVALSAHGCTVFRSNVGKVKTADGRWFDTGLPNGHPDLYGFKWKNGKVFYLEVKTPTGRPRKDQIRFHEMLARHQIIHGISRSVNDALTIVDKELVGYGFKDYGGSK